MSYSFSFHLHDDLSPALARAFRRRVGLYELTAFALQGTGQRAVVLTDRYLYLVARRLLSVSCRRWALRDVRAAAVEGERLVVTTRESRFEVPFPAEKGPAFRQAARRLNRAARVAAR